VAVELEFLDQRGNIGMLFSAIFHVDLCIMSLLLGQKPQIAIHSSIYLSMFIVKHLANVYEQLKVKSETRQS